MWSYGAFGLVILCASFWVGDLMNSKTKGIISGLLTASIIYIAGYLTGIIPTTQPADLGFSGIIPVYGLLLIVANLGTMVSLNDLLKQWKTVVICLASLVMMAFTIATVGSLAFGREIAWLAIAPISGGAVACTMVSDVAVAAGREDLAAFPMLLNVVQLLFGVPVSSFFVKKYCYKAVAAGEHLSYVESNNASVKKINLQIIPPIPDSKNTKHLILAKLAVVALASTWINKISGGKIPAAIVALLLGIILTEVGFLDRNSLQKSGFYEFLMFTFMAYLVSSFSSLTAERLKSFIVPMVGLLLIGVVSLALGSMLMGKVLKVDWRLAAALGPAAMFGYPFSQLLCEDVVREMHLPKDEADKMLKIVMPQLVIAGFCTVTLASVFVAGIVGPMIFK